MMMMSTMMLLLLDLYQYTTHHYPYRTDRRTVVGVVLVVSDSYHHCYCRNSHTGP
jgi:hypothetical protein